MAAAGSMRETAKALTAAFAAPQVPYPLPDELQRTIELFLERHHDIEDGDAQHLHEDLLSLYTRHVQGNPAKHGPFISVLRRVRPVLQVGGESRLDEWWGLVVKPIVNTVGHKRQELEEARGFLLDILVFDADDAKNGEHARLSKHFSTVVLDAYLSRTKLPSGAGDIVSPEDEFVSLELETILVAYGRRKPKEFLLALDRLFVQRQYRVQVLNLLSAFVRLQPPHLYLVLETSLIQHLETCLLIDTSSTAIELALIVLIMFLPHITSCLTSDHHLAKLFLIYSRILCWDKLGASGDANSANEFSDDDEDATDQGDVELDQPWEDLQHSEHYPDSSPPSVLHYFTFLYGLFPLNFMAFLRKPRKYLKSLNFPGADDFDLDQDLIHTRTEPYRRVHLLHPNTFTTTSEDELTDNRWLKTDPADVVTECMHLCVAINTTLDSPGPPPTYELPALPTSSAPQTEAGVEDDGTEEANEIESTVSWRNTQSTMFAPSTIGQPETFDIPPNPNPVMSSRSDSPLPEALDVLDSPILPLAKEDRNQMSLGVSLLGSQNLGPPACRLGNFAQAVTITTRPNSATNFEFENQSMAALQREIMLLRNDLNFERYLKQQHLTHIGQLQRRHINEATDAADTQNLINANRTLKARLAQANEQYTQLKKETLTSRSQFKKWEGELSTKVRSYRDDQKVWQNVEDGLRSELKKSQQDCEHLKKIVEKAEAEQLRAQQRTRALEFELQDYVNVRRELEEVQEKVLSFQDQGKELNALLHERNELRNDLEVANMRLNSREHERERAFKAYEQRIMELESRLQAAERHTARPGQLSGSVQQMLDSALAANNAKLQQMKKAYHHLLDRHTQLEMKYQDLEGESQAENGRYPQEKHTYNPEKQPLGRNLSFRQSNTYASKYLPPLSDERTGEEYDYQGQYHSPLSVSSLSINSPPLVSPSHPVRLESLGSRGSSTANLGFGQAYSDPYDATLNAHYQATNAETVSSGKSGYSVDTSSSKGDKTEKGVPKSDVRNYGRGGAQNVGKKVKDKERENEKEKEQKKQAPKTGGFRGLRGIM